MTTLKYQILGKKEDNQWVRIEELYPMLLEFKNEFNDLPSAQKAKGWLKSYISSHPSIGRKFPYKIVEISST